MFAEGHNSFPKARCHPCHAHVQAHTHGAGEMSWWIKRLLCKHEDLGFDPQYRQKVKSQVCPRAPVDQGAWEETDGSLELTDYPACIATRQGPIQTASCFLIPQASIVCSPAPSWNSGCPVPYPAPPCNVHVPKDSDGALVSSTHPEMRGRCSTHDH